MPRQSVREKDWALPHSFLHLKQIVVVGFSELM